MCPRFAGIHQLPTLTSTECAPMVLKAPGILTFMLSVILTVLALATRIFGASILYISGNELWVILLAQVILVFGCIMRGL